MKRMAWTAAILLGAVTALWPSTSSALVLGWADMFGRAWFEVLRGQLCFPILAAVMCTSGRTEEATKAERGVCAARSAHNPMLHITLHRDHALLLGIATRGSHTQVRLSTVVDGGLIPSCSDG